MKSSVYIILVNEDKELLLQLRDDKQEIPYPNYWGLIGGEIEQGELPLDAIKREISEEINCEVEDIRFIETFKEGELEATIYAGKIYESVEGIKLTEGQKVQYFPLIRIKEINIIPFIREIIFNNKEKILW
jgi:8-oxo-dGTP diphosphatase